MHSKDLSQLYYLKKDIERRERRIEELESEAERTTSLLSSMPKSKQSDDRLSRIVANIVDEKIMVMLKTEELGIERRNLEYIIDSVKDAKIRLYMSARFIDGMTWQQIANKCGNEITGEAARIAVERYMKEEKNDKIKDIYNNRKRARKKI